MKIYSTPPRSTAAKMHQTSLQRSLTLLREGIPHDLSGAEKRLAETDLKIALFRQKHGLLRVYRQIDNTPIINRFVRRK